MKTVDKNNQQHKPHDFDSSKDIQTEISAFQKSVTLATVTELGVIKVEGADAAKFLHNLVTNDIQTLSSTDLRFCGFCSQKGRLLASMHVWRTAEQCFYLLVTLDLLAPLCQLFSKYIMRSKVTLSDVHSEYTLLGMAGAAIKKESADLSKNLGFDLPKLCSIQMHDSFYALRLDPARVLFVVPRNLADILWERLAQHAHISSMNIWKYAEIQMGQPRITLATQELFVPQMLNFELPEVAGISFKKGCYPGQEIVARTQYLGTIKRRTYRASAHGRYGPGAAIFSGEMGDQACGTVVNAALFSEDSSEYLIVIQSALVETERFFLEKLGQVPLKLETLPYTVP